MRGESHVVSKLFYSIIKLIIAVIVGDIFREHRVLESPEFFSTRHVQT